MTAYGKSSREVQTWFREGDVSVQNDHVFSDSGLGDAAQVAWSAGDAAQHLGLSDHAPLVIEFDIPSIAMKNPPGRNT